MNPPSHNPEDQSNMLYTIAISVARIEERLDGLKNVDERLRDLEKTVSAIAQTESTRLENATRLQEVEKDIAEIIAKTPVKTSWWQIASGLAGFAGFGVSTTVILALLNR